jgi:branched-chain amino acid aminotransferase
MFRCKLRNMDSIWYINGKYVPQTQAHIPANDSGLIRGCAFFEYARTYNHTPFMLKEHIDRLFSAAASFDITLQNTKEEVACIVETLLTKNTSPNAGIKMLVSGGNVLDLIPEEKSALYIFVYPYAAFPEENYADGISLKTAHITRPFPECKTAFYLPGIMARKKATLAGYDEGLFVDDKGHLLECPTSNLFFLKDNTWHTPKEGVLKGLTRQVVLQIADLPITERAIHLSEIPTFDEVCTTSTNRAIMPISRIDSHPYQIGHATHTLMEAYELHVQKAVSLQTAH